MAKAALMIAKEKILWR